MRVNFAWLAVVLICPCFAQAQFEDMPREPLTIVVLDQDGKPVPNAEVHCVDYGSGPRFTELMPEEKAVTDQSGRVHFQIRPFGEAFARVTAGELGGWFRIQWTSQQHPEAKVKIGL